MGPDSGTWVPYRSALREDQRLDRAAQLVADKLEVRLRTKQLDPELATALAVALGGRAVVDGFLDLSIAALQNGFDDGVVRVADAALAMKAVPWLVETGLAMPREIGGMLRTAFLEAEVLVEQDGRQRIADFDEDNRQLLSDRRRKRQQRASSTERPRTVPGQSTERPVLQEQEQEQEEEPNRTEEEENLSLQAGESEDVEDPLLQELLTASRWKGRVATMRNALDDLRDSGLDDEAIRRRLHDLGKDAVGQRPYDLRNMILRRVTADRRPGRIETVPALEEYDQIADRQAASCGMSREEYDRRVKEWACPNSQASEVAEGELR